MARIVSIMFVPYHVGKKLSIFALPDRISLDQARTNAVCKSGVCKIQQPNFK